LLAVFPMPSNAVAYALSMRDALNGIGIDVRVGIHAGEIESRDDGGVSGIAVNLAARVEQQAADGSVWVSSTVRDMTLGGSARCEDMGEYSLKGIEGAWRLYAVS
jgi:class 3 adenylate cyclase